MALDPKASLAAALGAGPGKKAPPAPAPEPSDEGVAAMQEFLDAQAAGDAEGAWAAFKAMHAICNSYSDVE
jgi:hypothetical protein